MERNYLPSKQFVIRLIAVIVLVLISFGVYAFTGYLKSRSVKKIGAPTPIAVKDIVQKDSNGNGIPDWEETLWGLDPTKNGDANKEYINNKRALLAQSNNTDPTNQSQSTPENQALAQEFFAVVMSLQQTGNLDDNALAAIGDTIGSKIVAAPIPDVYTKNMLTIIPSTNQYDDDNELFKYYTAYMKIIIKHKNDDIGNELTYIGVALKNNDTGALAQSQRVAEAYRAFGKELVNTPTPEAYVGLALSMANNYEKTGLSIEGLSKLSTDPIVGMQAVINYKKYSNALISDTGSLSDKVTARMVQ